MMQVQILLATYNGEKYISELLASLQNQTFQDFNVFVSDDGSSDSTLSIIEEFASRDSRIKILPYVRSGSAKKNFMRLIADVDGSRIMFCDQDDVWLPEKIADFARAMQEAEAEYGATTPILIHSDLEVVDESLQTINESFFKYQHINYQATQLAEVLMQNPVTGCASIINAPLLDLARRKVAVDEIVMHDWWLAMIAAAFGKIRVLRKQSIKYRQHGSNSVGAQQSGLKADLSKVGRVLQENPASFSKKLLAQASAFQSLFDTSLDADQKRVLGAVQEFPKAGPWRRSVLMQRYGLKKKSFLKNVAIAMLFNRI